MGLTFLIGSFYMAHVLKYENTKQNTLFIFFENENEKLNHHKKMWNFKMSNLTKMFTLTKKDDHFD